MGITQNENVLTWKGEEHKQEKAVGKPAWTK